MQAFVLLQFLACITSSVLACLIITRNPGDRANRVGACIVAGGAFWAGCEVFWNMTDQADVALFFVRLGSLGWVFIGPMALHLFLEVSEATAVKRRMVLPWLYAGCALFVGIDWATSWVHPSVQRQEWGWSYDLGAGFPIFVALTIVCFVSTLYTVFQDYRHMASPGERSQFYWIAAALALPLSVTVVTDGVLPCLGIHTWRMGASLYTVLGAMIAWGFHRYGYSLLVPGNFAQEILEAMPSGVALLRLDGSVRSANGSLEKLLESSRGGLCGKRIEKSFSVPVLTAESDINDLECTMVLQEDGDIPVSVSVCLLRDKQGLPMGRVLVVKDLREVVALRNQLITSGRLAAVGELAAGVAHEINNPMAFVRANLQLLREHWNEITRETLLVEGREKMAPIVNEGVELIEESLEGVDRTTAIVRDIRSFARAGGGSRKLADLNELLDAVLRITAGSFHPGTVVERKYQSSPLVSCDPQELKQVFLNLLVNAAHAVGNSGTIRVETANDEEWVVVAIEDNGSGIGKDLIDRVFDPFFTTKTVGQGVGLGLAISYQIVRAHDGDIWVESELGSGTRVTVTLPAANEFSEKL